MTEPAAKGLVSEESRDGGSKGSRIARRDQEARDLVEEAVRLYHSKGNLVGARQARSLLAAPALI